MYVYICLPISCLKPVMMNTPYSVTNLNMPGHTGFGRWSTVWQLDKPHVGSTVKLEYHEQLFPLLQHVLLKCLWASHMFWKRLFGFSLCQDGPVSIDGQGGPITIGLVVVINTWREAAIASNLTPDIHPNIAIRSMNCSWGVDLLSGPIESCLISSRKVTYLPSGESWAVRRRLTEWLHLDRVERWRFRIALVPVAVIICHNHDICFG